MKWRSLPIVAFDTETTGLTPFSGDRVIEFAAVRTFLTEDGRVGPIEAFSWLVNPGIPIPKAARDITGISDADVAEQPGFDAIAPQVRELLTGAVTVAHNYPFDLAFVTLELGRSGLTWPHPSAEIDTVDVSLRAFPDAKGHRLGDLCERLDVVLTGAHRATNDAEATLRCFAELTRRHQVVDDLQALLEWSGGIGLPPNDGPLVVDDHGNVRLAVGPHEGALAGDHPVHLHWMLKARRRTERGWSWRFPEGTRRWIERFLAARGSGRAAQGEKATRPEEWGLDPCISARGARGGPASTPFESEVGGLTAAMVGP
jgi:DNA polymerase III epsilon subunit-like protein